MPQISNDLFDVNSFHQEHWRCK